MLDRSELCTTIVQYAYVRLILDGSPFIENHLTAHMWTHSLPVASQPSQLQNGLAPIETVYMRSLPLSLLILLVRDDINSMRPTHPRSERAITSKFVPEILDSRRNLDTCPLAQMSCPFLLLRTRSAGTFISLGGHSR